MKYNELSLKRHQNAGRKAVFSQDSRTANFSTPLWQAGALAGAGLGTLRGGLEQNEDGTQIDPASRLMNIGANAAAGATLLGAAGAGVPELMRENPTALRVGQGVYEATGITPDMNQIPMRTADRIRYQREMARRQHNGILQRTQQAIDPITGRLEILAEDVGNITRPVRNVVNKGVQAVAQQFQPDPGVQMQQQAIRQAVDASIADESTRLAQQAVRSHLNSPEIAEQIRQEATRNANKFVQQVVDKRNPVQKAVDAVGDVARATPQIAQQAIDTTKDIAGKTGSAARTVVAAPYKAGEATRQMVNQASQSPLGQRLMSGVAKVRSTLGFSYMGDTADFYSPYTIGAAGGAVLGTGIGAGMGLANSITNARDLEQAQLDQIQAIPDPYARKKEWDVYDSNLSRTGRTLGYGIQGVGNTVASAGLGAAGGALLGGAALTGYENLRKKKFNLFGQPTPSRIDGLKTFLTGR